MPLDCLYPHFPTQISKITDLIDACHVFPNDHTIGQAIEWLLWEMPSPGPMSLGCMSKSCDATVSYIARKGSHDISSGEPVKQTQV
jgi:hypothetical protein